MLGTLLPRRDRPSLASHLLYDSYDPDGHVFVHRDGSLAVAWRVGMKDTEVAGPAEMEAVASRFADFFRHLPAGAAAQWILMADRDVRDSVDRFRGASGGAFGELFDAHCATVIHSSVDYAGTVFLARTLRALFTLRIFPALGGGEEAMRENYARAKASLAEHASAVEGFFTQTNLSHRRLNADEVVACLYRILNPVRAGETEARHYREDLPIRDQVVRTAASFDYGRGILSLDGVALRVLSMVEIPEKTFPGMVSRAPLSAPGVLDLIPEATLVMNIGILDDSEMRRRLEKRDAFAWRQLQNPRKKLDLVRIKEDAEGALGELMSGRRALSVRFHVVLAGPSPESVLERSRAVVGAIDRLGIEMIEEDALALAIFLQSLPMGYDPAGDRGMKRAFTMISGNVADLLPVYGSFQGTPTPDILLQNRRGEPVAFSFFDSEVAPHGIVTGVSGAGKSFAMNYMLASLSRRGAHIIILDRGESYRNLCELLGGQYVRFEPERPLRINPIGRAETLDKERLLFVKDILAEMCSQGEEPVRKEERTVIENAVLRAVAKKREGEVVLSEVYEALLEEARIGPRSIGRDLDRLVLSLKPFVGQGAYAGYFDGPGEIDFTRSFTVYELGEIALRREIAPALLMAIMYNAASFCGAAANLDLKKYLVIDEAWTLLQSPATSRFIENALRTYRKFNASAIMVTQQVADFQGPAGTAIRANAPNRIFLRQTPETVLAMERLFELSPEVKEAIASLVTAKGRFSEMFVETPAVRGIARLVPSPELYTAFSTDGDDRARLHRLVAERRKAGDPAPLVSAIRTVAERRGRPGKVA